MYQYKSQAENKGDLQGEKCYRTNLLIGTLTDLKMLPSLT